MIRAFTTAISVAALGLITVLPATAQEPTGGVVSIGGAVTEIVFALGAQDQLVARDTTSSYPPEAAALPDVGYMRALSPEGVLATGPKLIIAEEGAGPPETIEVLEQADIPFVTVPDDYTAEGVSAKIRAVGQALGKGPQAEALAAEVHQKLAEVSRATQDRPQHPRRADHGVGHRYRGRVDDRSGWRGECGHGVCGLQTHHGRSRAGRSPRCAGDDGA